MIIDNFKIEYAKARDTSYLIATTQDGKTQVCVNVRDENGNTYWKTFTFEIKVELGNNN